MLGNIMKKILLVVFLLLAVALFFYFDIQRFFSLDYILAQKQQMVDFASGHFVLAATAYFLIYTIVFALALPVGAILTLVGGAIFGLGWGVILVSFASSVGSLLSFLAARFLLRDWVNERFGKKLAPLNEGVVKEGAFYLFTLRLVPLFAPAIINLSMGLTAIKAWTFYWVSQLGMLAGTVVYVNAGTELGKIQSGQPIISQGLILAFILLGIFPLIAKRALNIIKRRKVYAPYKKPNQFDHNMIVIGAGSGGLVSAYIAAQVKADVVLIEKHKMGGDCLNTGCVPSKTLLRSAKMAHYIRGAETYGVKAQDISVDFPAVMERVQKAIKTIEPHDSVERYTDIGVTCMQGEAKILSPYQVQVGDKTLTTQNIVIATGARPWMLNIDGIDKVPVYNSDTIWSLREQPEHLLVIGSGPIGCELAQAFSRLGSRVTVLTNMDKVMDREDDDVCDLVLQKFRSEGIEVFLNQDIQRLEMSESGPKMISKEGDDEHTFSFSHLLMAVGRRPNTDDLGLEELGIELRPNGTVDTDEYLRTKYPNIYAVGDVTGPYQFTHTASHQAWYAAVNALFGRFRSFKVDYSVVPWATFTDPEVARVGLNEKEAQAQGIDFEVTQYALDDLDRAIADGETAGFVKVITPRGKDKILGATIVGYHAGELINEFIATMKRGGKLNDILSTIHIYPTLGEANKFAAGEWRKAHKPEKLLTYVERFHRWSKS